MEEMRYTLEQLLESSRFRRRADALKTILPDGEFTLEEADAALTAFMERSVK